ncbi:MAG: VOC family protein [Chitinophagales bacterium]
MEIITHTVYWVEIPVLQFDRAKLFYNTLYAFQMTEATSVMGRIGYLPFDKILGVGAAIVQGPGYTPAASGIKVYLNAGTNLSVLLNRVVPAGGKVLVPKTLVSAEIGYSACFSDTEGNVLWLHSPA